MGLTPGSGRAPGEGNSNPIQYSCLGNSMDRGAWQATVHGITKSPTQWLTNNSNNKCVNMQNLILFNAICLKKLNLMIVFSSLVMSDSSRPHGLQHSRLPCTSPTPGACSNACLSSQWCHPIIPSSVVPFSSHLQSFPASGSFPMSQIIVLGGQSIGVSASASVLPMNIQDFFPLGWTD